MLSNVVFKSNIKWNIDNDFLSFNKEKINLNYSEYQVLRLLFEQIGKPVSKEVLISAAWPNRVITDSSLFQVIRSLRSKLSEPEKGVYLENISKFGYMLKLDALTITRQKKPIAVKTIAFFCIVIIFVFAFLSHIAEFFSSKKTDEQLYISQDRLDNNYITLYADEDNVLVSLREYTEKLVSILDMNERLLYLYQTKDELYISGCNAKEQICNNSESFSLVLSLDEKEQRLAQIAQDIQRHYLVNESSLPRQQWITKTYRYSASNTPMQYSTQNINSGEYCNDQVFSGVVFASNSNNKSQFVGITGGRVSLQKPDSEVFVASLNIYLSLSKFEPSLTNEVKLRVNKRLQSMNKKADYRAHLPYSREELSLLLIPHISMNWVYGIDVSMCMESK